MCKKRLFGALLALATSVASAQTSLTAPIWGRIVSPTDGQGLVFNGATGEWVNRAISGGGGSLFSNSVTATLGANQNNYQPAGWTATTNRFLLAAAAGGSTITGLDATGVADGTAVLIVNTSTTDIIEFPHLSGSSSAGNQFSNADARTIALPPLGSSLFVLVASIGWIAV